MRDPNKRIVFGSKKKLGTVEPDGAFSSVVEAPFPSERTCHWKPMSAASNGTDTSSPEVAVIFSQEVLLGVNEHVSLSLERELGGFLLGNRYHCPNTGRGYVIIDQYSAAKFAESTRVNLSFTHEAWAQLSDELNGKFLGKLVIGWYHSHPRMKVFLSTSDLLIHQGRFPEHWMFALVVEPEQRLAGIFGWANGEVDGEKLFDFYELFERRSKKSVVHWRNYYRVL